MVNTVRSGSTRRGVALVDAIAAVIILGMSLTVILSLTGQALTSQRVGEELQNAAMLADEQLNMVLARGADDYAKSFPTDGVCDPPFDRPPTYRYKVEINGQGGAAPYQVKVTISWSSPGAQDGERRVTVETLMSGNHTPVNQLDRQPEQPVERPQ